MMNLLAGFRAGAPPPLGAAFPAGAPLLPPAPHITASGDIWTLAAPSRPLSRALPSLPRLRQLLLDGNTIAEFELPPELPALQMLDLSDNRLGLRARLDEQAEG